MRLKEFFHDQKSPDAVDETNAIEAEQCEINTKITNPYYNPPFNESTALTSYLSAVKNKVINLLKKTFLRSF